MSQTLRNKLFKELEKKATKRLTTYSKLKNVGAIFDEGTTLIGKGNFMNEIANWRDKTISNVQHNLTPEEIFEVSAYEGEWVDRGKAIYDQIKKLSDEGKEKWILHQPKGLQKVGWNTKEIVFHYKRNPRSKYVGAGLEGLFNNRLKRIVKKVINDSKIKIDYSHGKSLPKDMMITRNEDYWKS